MPVCSVIRSVKLNTTLSFLVVVPTALHQLVNPSYIPLPVGSWTVRIKHPGHNHGPIGSETQDTKCPVAESLTVIKQCLTMISMTLFLISKPKRKRKIKKAPKGPEPLPTASISPPTVLHNTVPELSPPVQVPNALVDVVNISRLPPATPSYAVKALDSSPTNSAFCLRFKPLGNYDSEALPTPAPPSPANPVTSVDSPLPSPTSIIPAIITTLSPRGCSGPSLPITPTNNNGDDSFDIVLLLPITSPSKHPEESCATFNTIQTKQLTCTNVRPTSLTPQDH
ncbi:uncharacterized protein MELLADRAFT_113648 [Melampsora larici-populina 98AG31]|uniref:Uncharacterized protein n=1 Tax=Melampsora larici-populina (strain 98AG31 / pathotype 3-4-7) TaxID=747676 RepID=F4SAL0_MELLP|nr:uncharacterized protein MELLADRAFT_113648 [Melampsora larici-populina 98AG31]EGF98318.1 hypothetical protein MELLADRAFT_113648 [Melampsora larici-populina 98AG31]